MLKPDQFSRVFSVGLRSKDNLFIVLANPNGLDYGRLGLAISKKKTRLAVNRNHLKRIVRESFRTNQSIIMGLDLVVMNLSGSGLAANNAYWTSLERHWRKLAKKCAVS